MISATSGSQPLRGFVAREPELALRLLVGAHGVVRQRVRAGVQALLESAYADEAEELAGFADVLVDVGMALEWSTLVAGDEPSAERIAQIARALLAGARAGEL